ncbi:hypothetical protein NEOLEDRAFT_1140054 [Neolentinus lepideus HHB14362 ss-1]|uniref:Uncharacterized protein n=1 Tax=Neolentinus lepideus HHB14362 ss-1 TaxID=1314782 RepID=A0A165PGU0_9AGAM|nr:hypothetical protein NEOLEDRAFT_1140054 [Neolentinus lepideus HHB14362 ss-1]
MPERGNHMETRLSRHPEYSYFHMSCLAFLLSHYQLYSWSEISPISLNELNKTERKFLMGVDFDLYVDKSTYESWEKDSRRWHRGRGKDVRVIGRVVPVTVYRPTTRCRQEENGDTSRRHRARSTSPVSRAAVYPNSSYHHFTFALPPLPSTTPRSVSSHRYPSPEKDYFDSPVSPTSYPGEKRSANTAFSCTSGSYDTSLTPPRPAKRPTSMHGLTLEIPECTVRSRADQTEFLRVSTTTRLLVLQRVKTTRRMRAAARLSCAFTTHLHRRRTRIMPPPNSHRARNRQQTPTQAISILLARMVGTRALASLWSYRARQ